MEAALRQLSSRWDGKEVWVLVDEAERVWRQATVLVTIPPKKLSGEWEFVLYTKHDKRRYLLKDCPKEVSPGRLEFDKIQINDDIAINPHLANEVISLRVQLAVAAQNLESTKKELDDINSALHEIDIDRLKIESARKKKELRHRHLRAASRKRLAEDLKRRTRIGAIEKQFVSMGGPHGGWDHRDHEAFLGEWTRIGCNPVPVPFSTTHKNEYPAVVTTPTKADNRHLDSPNKHSNEIGQNTAAADVVKSAAGDSSADELVVTGTALIKSSRTDMDDPGDTNSDIDYDNDNDSNNDSEDDLELPPGYEHIDSIDVDHPPAYDGERAAISLMISRHHRLSLLKRLPIVVPGRSEEEFEDHIDFYLKWLALSMEKKGLLLGWDADIVGELLTRQASEQALEVDCEQRRRRSEKKQRAHSMNITGAYRQWEQDVLMTYERRCKVEMHQRQQRPRVELLSEVTPNIEFNVKRDPQRLFTPTKAYKSQMRASQTQVQERVREAQKKQEQDEAEKRARRASSADPAEIRRRRERDLQMIQDRKEKIEAHQRKMQPRKLSPIRHSPGGRRAQEEKDQKPNDEEKAVVEVEVNGSSNGAGKVMGVGKVRGQGGTRGSAKKLNVGE